jgi:energy-coupling factor transport system substrate-specific component
VTAASRGPRGSETAALGQVGVPDGRVLRVRPRAAAAVLLASVVGVLGFTWPLLVSVDAPLASAGDATLLFALLLPLLVAVVMAELADGGMDARTVAMLGVLAAAGAALRPLGTGIAGFEPIFFLLVLAGRAYGSGFGFALGATTLFASALVTAGVGPWLPFQMLGAAWVAAGAGLLPRRLRGRAELAVLGLYGALAGLLYGLLLNLTVWPLLFRGTTVTAISFVPGDAVVDNLQRFVAFTLATSLGFDVPRALLTGGLVVATGRPLLRALRRAGRRAAFDAPVTFAAPITFEDADTADHGGSITGPSRRAPR